MKKYEMKNNKVKDNWNNNAAAYSAHNHTDKIIGAIIDNPANAFHHTTWEMIQRAIPNFADKKVCVPSSGDNLAVFAFALLGAKVTSCDISENQLANAERIAKQHSWDIEFICSDTMKLDNIKSNEYDFVYTSNGVHVWINNLFGMYRNIHRIMKPGGVYIMYEIHPFLRPFDGESFEKCQLSVIKPYNMTGPFEDETSITFGWRIQDIMNAIFDSGLTVKHMEEMFAKKSYDDPFWIPYYKKEQGATATREEVDSMHDWQINPMAALPNWLSIEARK